MQCSATVYKTGKQCTRHAVTGMKVCWVHGGATPKGIASPHYKHGRDSKYLLPLRLRANYDAALKDPRLLELRDEIAVIDTRLADLIGRVDTGESGSVWRALHDARWQFIAAQRGNDIAGQTVALNAILELIARGHTDYAAWHEIGQTIEQRRRLVESERKRFVEAHQMITSEQALALLNALLDSVKEHVNDRNKLVAIQATFNRITARDGEPNIIDAEPG